MQIVELESDRIVAYEALTDLSSSLENAPSDHWLKIAADTGIISQLEREVFTRALLGYVQQRQHLKRQKRKPNQLKVTVNLTAATLGQPGCAEWLKLAASKYGVPTRCVVIEVTEHQPLTDEALGQIRRAKDLGFQIFLDDFGTKHATPETARKLAGLLDGIKLPLSAVQGIELDDMPLHAVAGRLIREAHALKVPVIVAEGIQREGQRAIVFDLGATHGQGWIFSAKCNLPTSLRQLDRNGY
jgi:EAL domain-containing protein (putative c-di-GMP-specific phosphodiesterase class I)